MRFSTLPGDEAAQSEPSLSVQPGGGVLTPPTIELPLTGAGSEFTIQDGSSQLQRTILPGGTRVLTEVLPGAQSVTIGMWVAAGSRDERDGEHGATHFLEHLLFKGTPTRSAEQIAATLDAVGGDLNAATGKEYTAYHARVLGVDLPLAVEVLGDMVTSSLLDRQEFAREREVILDELAMAADDPTDVVHEEFCAAAQHGGELARPVGGTAQTVKAIAWESVREHYDRVYHAPELVVVAAGAVNHAQLVELVARALERGGWLAGEEAPRGRRSGGQAPALESGQVRSVRRPVEQAHLVLGARSFAAGTTQRWPMSVFLSVLGGGMSSRLFQEVREKRGWAYSTYSYDSRYSDSGHFGLYAGCAPSRVHDVTSVLLEQWYAMASEGPTAEEMARARGQLRGSLVLGLEDTGARMFRLGHAEIVYGHLTPVERMVERLEAVTAADVAAVASRLWAAPRAFALVGPVGASASLEELVARA
ncbi:pitrilysin family protein [Buchananella felis]|uniref:M16 family metallopeptidase n=1 Tax=Buchananella felis TaxID=3231492 RepID=UPI00352949AB